MFLIASAAYIDNEFKAELGTLPPAFLPIGNRRLYELQIEEIRKWSCREIFLSLPLSYNLEQKDIELLSELDIKIISLEDGFTIGESISTSLKLMPRNGLISILYGDTLIRDLPQMEECLALGQTNDHYNWMVEDSAIDNDVVWAGYFSFRDRQSLIQTLINQDSDFIETVKEISELGHLDKVIVNEWLDFGHINTYFQARSKLTTERSFNSLEVKNNVVTKKSFNNTKILAEANWFQKIPSSIKRLTPNFIEAGQVNNQAYYSIEYLYYMPLNELIVHGKLPASAWKVVLDSCMEYFKSSLENKIPETSQLISNRSRLISNKTYTRLRDFEVISPIRFDLPIVFNSTNVVSINNIVDEMVEVSLKVQPIFSAVHGDFCFSNILFDSRARIIKLIDPRGIDENGSITIYGDLIYDLAKFYHSVIGLYDFIISHSYCLDIQNQNINFQIFASDDVLCLGKLSEMYEFIPGYSENQIMPLVILLFFSMLPMHSDNYERQCALLSNAVRLYVAYKGI